MITRVQNNRPTILLESLESRRLMSGGTLDSTFGTQGVFTLPDTSPVSPIAVQKDGKMLLVTTASQNQIRRLRVGGGTDKTYAINGTTTLPFAIHAMAVEGDGKLVVAGIAINEGGTGTPYQMVVARLTTSGKFDPTFGRKGVFALAANSGSEGESIAMRAGKIAISGRINGEDPVVVVLNLDGTADTTFSGDGVQTLGTGERATDVSIGKDSSITTLLAITGGGGFRTARVTASGAFDSTYSGDGISSLVKLAGPSRFINGDGSMIVAGLDETRNIPVLARITSRGKLDSSFGNAGFQDLSTRKDLFPSATLQSPNGTRYIYGAVGSASSLSTEHIFLARLTTDYHVDTNFATQGFLTISPHVEDSAFSADFTPQGDKLILAGGAYSKTSFRGFSSELIRVIL
ncbi:MAG TPA: hypothetical protein VHS31_15100 [Tepidisphaeraceae bacterium]|jgi:uncharacterized delta-60 repeat protein|nr:hypothetical protein [Tepidisphaeraceae bacterium]